MLFLDDVYVADRQGRPRFVPVSAPSAVELPPLVVFQPLDFPARLAAPVPRPRGLRMSSPRIAGPVI
jgi:hypothetical protein